MKLTLNQVQRDETCKALLQGRLTTDEAALALGLSRRPVQRLQHRLQADGPQALRHGNSARPPANKTPEALRQRILDLAATTYAHVNFSHLADLLAEEHGIHLSEETLRRWLRPLGHGRPRRRGKHRRRRTRRTREGELLFLDGSPHPWFGPQRPSGRLLLASDEATGKPLWGQFQPEEDRDGCFAVCYHVFVRFGLPAAFYLDRASQFVTTRYGGLRALHDPERPPTHFEQAMSQLRIGLIFACSPPARGRGERLNGSFQDRLVAARARRRIRTLRRATDYLNTVFIPRYRRRFGRAPADDRPAWRPLPDGTRAGFTFAPVEHQIPGLVYYTPAWQPDPGVDYRLSSAGGVLTLAGQRLCDLKTALPYNPATGYFNGPAYTLTAPDGTVYQLDSTGAVQERIGTDGSRLIYSDSGITNVATGDTITFQHDSAGRLTQITAVDGSEVLDSYDAAGNLVSARNLAAGEATRYGYAADGSHLLTLVVSPSPADSAVIRYTPAPQVLPLAGNLGTAYQFDGATQTTTLSAGGTDRYVFILRPSEVQSTASSLVYLGVAVQAAAGSSLQPAVPVIAGLTPVVTRTGPGNAYALYAIDQTGLDELDIAAGAGTSGAYSVQLIVAGDVNQDGTVNGVDAQLFAAAAGSAVGQPGYVLAADPDRDGKVDATDAQILAQMYGFAASLPPVVTPTPECRCPGGLQRTPGVPTGRRTGRRRRHAATARFGIEHRRGGGPYRQLHGNPLLLEQSEGGRGQP